MPRQAPASGIAGDRFGLCLPAAARAVAAATAASASARRGRTAPGAAEPVGRVRPLASAPGTRTDSGSGPADGLRLSAGRMEVPTGATADSTARGRTARLSASAAVRRDPRAVGSGVARGAAVAASSGWSRGVGAGAEEDEGPGAGASAGGGGDDARPSPAGAGAGAGASTDAGGAGDVARGGRSESGSTYPSGSEAIRIPRCTYGCATSASPLGPIVPTVAPSETPAPRVTPIEPRCTSVTA